MKSRTAILSFLFCVYFFLLPAPTLAENGNIRFQQMAVQPGEKIKVPLFVDEVENLAGIKLVVEYDHQRLQYKGLRKAKKAGGLMHMVNDKEPGSLILVMAGAVGLALDEEPLAFFHFRVNENAKPGKIVLHISHVEVMADTLKPVPVRTTDGKILIQNGQHDKANQE